jgi:hypothetical protein
MPPIRTRITKCFFSGQFEEVQIGLVKITCHLVKMFKRVERWINRLGTFQAHLKAQLVNYSARGRQNVNTVSKAGQTFHPKPRFSDGVGQ